MSDPKFPYWPGAGSVTWLVSADNINQREVFTASISRECLQHLDRDGFRQLTGEALRHMHENMLQAWDEAHA
ncbi:MAG: hypothetical protein H0U60_20225 [Blastocatellia bacterium]|nr:hypothetical protein [Blastocatellia bacterium]